MNWGEFDRNHLIEKLTNLREIIKAGLNAGNGDGEWEALVDAAGLLGLEYDEEEDKYA
jgi:hypothetical protein